MANINSRGASSSSGPLPEVRKVTMRSSDGLLFEVEENVAMELGTLRHMIEDNCAKGLIPLPNVSSSVLTKLLEYCRKHAEAAPGTENGSVNDELKSWDQAFAHKLVNNQDLLFDLIMAANYLDVRGLYELTCQKVADMMKGKSPEEIRKLFNITNDYTPEEEAEVRRENEWAFI